LDPVDGTRRALDLDAADEIDGHAYAFYDSLNAKAVSPLRLAFSAIQGSRRDLMRVIALACAAGVLGLLNPVLTAWLAESVIPLNARREIPVVITALVVSAICSALLNMSSGLALQRTGIRAASKGMASVWDRTLNLPAAFFRQFMPADLAMRILGVERIRESLAGPVAAGVIACLFSVFHVLLLIHFAQSLAIPAMGLAVGVAAISALGGRLTMIRQRQFVAWETRTAGKALQFIQGVAKLRVAGAEQRAFASWAGSFAKARIAAARVRQLSIILATLQAAAPIAGWFLMASLAAGDANLSQRPAHVLAFSVSFQFVLGAALQMSGLFLAWAQVSVYLDRVRPVLDARPEFRLAGRDPGSLRGRVDVRDLSFRYDSTAVPVLQGISFSVEPGEFVAFVGQSGSGKSTLIRLLLGFEHAQSGSVSYDAQELASFDIQALRRQLGVVLQDGQVFSGSVASNILGASGLELDEAWAAAELAGIAREIRSMPMGMSTVLPDRGSTLSGGQRQRILIARALVRKPSVLLFDEATSALDNTTQAAVTRGLEGTGATRIVVAHRLSTIRNADRIYVLDSGRIVESGTYPELMALKGQFFEMAMRQAISA
jgi:ATP-binding cassette subfamily C protein